MTPHLLLGFVTGFSLATVIVVYVACRPQMWWPR